MEITTMDNGRTTKDVVRVHSTRAKLLTTMRANSEMISAKEMEFIGIT